MRFRAACLTFGHNYTQQEGIEKQAGEMCSHAQNVCTSVDWHLLHCQSISAIATRAVVSEGMWMGIYHCAVACGDNVDGSKP